MTPLIVIAAGGTGGHMFPAQALAEEMLRRGWRVALSSDARGLRFAGGFPPEVVRRRARAATFARGGAAAKLAAPGLIALGVAETAAWFARARPAVVAGFGGYPSLPALAAATLTGRPRLIHEQNGVLGRVNRLFAPRVAAVACGTWPVANAPAGARLVRTGNPLRADALRAAAIPYAPPAPDGPLRLLVFGGSQGARAFSRLTPAAAALLPEDMRARLRVTQQARPEDAEALRAAWAALGVQAEVAPFFDDLPARMARAHLALSRAGASTMAELTAIGRPAILIPYPQAMDDHQSANARGPAEAGAAVALREDGLTASALASHIHAILSDPARAADMAARARALGVPDAGARLADLVERVAARAPIAAAPGPAPVSAAPSRKEPDR
ncbi:UDP-N-acetylglucosamine--N-acetylmuramyl-(pentapeptide) pyrophosphoryl-undecaprenol N-acetylglucosamine transferase [Oceanicella actignis]|uniref:UDP-N-acetylglucosamine--N-acetylmuramyl-(pentapeptide) pyrophosphoryl-undecaprenol N-acetylglucosamine transferase n=1 Tax=Oceanicella actignis TaxID=1189325 RepID=A0A1M7SB32_9RHOB|nr:UDP-N-acetylglucosamine-N-acetylmuramylpentapeptide N-acetylglucosamine transferase [Oceanicella actignis]SET28461.1 UDP-N-acetylglucosamine-N-acetylmuramylpentapeptide N-acetylglucosamine transferase [Oceanicella actignis]SHN55673.1 UDP-N-acetylglucosamine--N-acetylmuramyl-(pentapeptide) pyrophosphoryl-undecaprenol N-acetylglucosamine transferase [Oceanicella actignis]